MCVRAQTQFQFSKKHLCEELVVSDTISSAGFGCIICGICWGSIFSIQYQEQIPYCREPHLTVMFCIIGIVQIMQDPLVFQLGKQHCTLQVACSPAVGHVECSYTGLIGDSNNFPGISHKKIYSQPYNLTYIRHESTLAIF